MCNKLTIILQSLLFYFAPFLSNLTKTALRISWSIIFNLFCSNYNVIVKFILSFTAFNFAFTIEYFETKNLESQIARVGS